MKTMKTLVAGAAVGLWGVAAQAADDKEPRKAVTKEAKSVHDFKVKTILDKDFDLRKLEKNVVLIVNVASQ